MGTGRVVVLLYVRIVFYIAASHFVINLEALGYIQPCLRHNYRSSFPWASE